MKKIVLTLVMGIFAFGMSAQSSCSCDEFFGKCKVVGCPSGTLATCEGTWYHSCKCYCEEVLTQAPTTHIYSIDLNDVEYLVNLFEENKVDELNILQSLFAELYENSKNGVFKTEDEELYDSYFYKLNSFFNKLDIENKEKLVSMIES